METLILSILGLTALQIVLGIDNVIFLSIVTADLEADFKKKSRQIGIGISFITNTILILCVGFLANMKSELFTLFDKGYNLHNLIMIGGGLFLVFKAVKELYKSTEHNGKEKTLKQSSMLSMILTMTSIDFIFSIDSAITAIGMSELKVVQLVSTLLSIIFLFLFFNPLNKLIDKHPSFKILALAFLVLIGFSLFVEGMGVEIPKGYIYSMMLFAIAMETLNIRFDKKTKTTNTNVKINTTTIIPNPTWNDNVELLQRHKSLLVLDEDAEIFKNVLEDKSLKYTTSKGDKFTRFTLETE